MAASRHLRGTVLSRISNLLRAGAISEPLWFPVVQAFPPLTETKINRKGDEELMHKITYPEDEFRKYFYQRFQTNQPLYLWGDETSHCDRTLWQHIRFVDTCMDQLNQGMNKEEAIENTVKKLFTSNTTTMPVHEKDQDNDWLS